MKSKTYQLQITLRGSKPRIWRRILVPSSLPLADFHQVIQTTMGWTNSHLHQFIKDKVYYAPRYPDDDHWEEWDQQDYAKLKVSDLLKKVDDRITYEYDFGDGWQHQIILEKIMAQEGPPVKPTCLSGRHSCPPEDCGGIWGYAEMLRVLKNPEHEEYEEYLGWLGGEFDPKHFDKDEVNALLG